MKKIYLRNLILFISTLILLFGISSYFYVLINQEIILVFRLDDYSNRSSIKIEKYIINIFREHKIPLTIGVIPFGFDGDFLDPSPHEFVPLSTEKVANLKTAMDDSVIEVALHGFSHQTINPKGSEWNTEFLGLDYQTQEDKISKGQILLEQDLGIGIHTFIPPFNNYDSNTLLALENRGIDIISASVYGYADEESPVGFIPQSVDLPNVITAIRKARRYPDLRPLILVTLHNYDIGSGTEGSPFPNDKLIKLLDWVNDQSDIRKMTVSQAGDYLEEISGSRLVQYQAYVAPSWLVPPFLSMIPNGEYLSASALKVMLLIRNILTLIYYSLVLLGSMTLSYYLGHILQLDDKRLSLVMLIGAVITITITIISLRDFSIGYRGLSITVVMYGVLLGLFVLRNKRSRSIPKSVQNG